MIKKVARHCACSSYVLARTMCPPVSPPLLCVRRSLRVRKAGHGSSPVAGRIVAGAWTRRGAGCVLRECGRPPSPFPPETCQTLRGRERELMVWVFCNTDFYRHRLKQDLGNDDGKGKKEKKDLPSLVSPSLSPASGCCNMKQVHVATHGNPFMFVETSRKHTTLKSHRLTVSVSADSNLSMSSRVEFLGLGLDEGI